MAEPLTYGERFAATPSWSTSLDAKAVLAIHDHFLTGQADPQEIKGAVTFAMPRDTTLFRGASLASLTEGKPLTEGMVLSAHPTVMSTSMERDVCYAYAEDVGPGVILHILTRKGQLTAPTYHIADKIWDIVDEGDEWGEEPAPWVLDGYDVLNYPGGCTAADFQCNDEWLLPQGTRLQVVKVEKECDDIQVAHVIIID